MNYFCICDDDSLHLMLAYDLLSTLSQEMDIECSIDAFTNAKSLLDAASKKIYTLAILDMMIGNDHGIDLARKLSTGHHAPAIVFTTAFEEFAVESFDVSPLHYLIKPVTREKMASALDRFQKLQQSDASLRLEPEGQGLRIVAIGDIDYLEALQAKVIVHLHDSTELVVSEMLYTFEEQLPETLFFRSHRSYLVNLSRVVSIRKFEFVLQNKVAVPIAKRRYQQAKLALLRRYGSP